MSPNSGTWSQDFTFLRENYFTSRRYLRQDKHPGPESADSIILDEAWDAEGVVEAVGVERVHELGEGPGGAHDGEHGQEHAPPGQRAPEVECWPEMIFVTSLFSPHALSPVGHVGLAPEDEEHVDAAGPGAHGAPVLLHPYPDHVWLEILVNVGDVSIVFRCKQTLLYLFKIEDIGVVVTLHGVHGSTDLTQRSHAGED